jgi:hypothetical protein
MHVAPHPTWNANTTKVQTVVEALPGKTLRSHFSRTLKIFSVHYHCTSSLPTSSRYSYVTSDQYLATMMQNNKPIHHIRRKTAHFLRLKSYIDNKFNFYI